MKLTTTVTIIGLTVILTAIGCVERSRDPRLERIAGIVSDSPREAMASLDSIDPSSLSNKDKAFYNLLTIKARDKTYIKHTSDTLILSVISYAGAHKEKYCPEALYYAGRVYRDLGDYPVALEYFHKALALLPAGESDAELRSLALSHTGGLLNDLRLYDEAVPYIQESIEYDRQLNDTAAEVYDLQLLGSTYMRADRLKSADSCLHIALALARKLDPTHLTKTRMYIAGVKKKLGQTDSALLYIRNTLDSVKPMVRNSVLAYASQIYRQAGIYDTAYMYARELVNSPDITSKSIGYEVIFSDSVQGNVPPDSLRKYATDYYGAVETSFNEHGAQMAIMQQSVYNYNLHRHEREKAEKRVMTQRYWIMGFAFLLAVASVVILWLKNRNKKNILELRAALDNVTRLEQSLNTLHSNEMQPAPELTPVDPGETAEELRERLKGKLLRMYKAADTKRVIVPMEILESEPYHRLQEIIRKGGILEETDPLWNELEKAVERCSPKFKEHLCLLVGGKMSYFDLHTCLLIKCGVGTSQMATLADRTNGAITSRRRDISIRIYGENLGSAVINGIIRLL